MTARGAASRQRKSFAMPRSISTPACSTRKPASAASFAAAPSVPPVASTSSTRIRRPAPRCISSTPDPYSSAYWRSTMGGGSLPFLRTGTNPLPRFSASAAARMKPRDSTPATASASDHSRSFHSASSAETASWKCERSSGVMSRNRMPGCGKSGTSTTYRASGCMVSGAAGGFGGVRADECGHLGDGAVSVEEAADRREHVRHAVPDGRERTGSPRSVAQRVVEQDLRAADVQLRRRQAVGAPEQGRDARILEVEAGRIPVLDATRGLGTEHRIDAVVARERRAAKRQVQQGRHQHDGRGQGQPFVACAHRGDEREVAARRIAGEHDPRRVEALRQHPVPGRMAVVRRRRERVLRREAVVDHQAARAGPAADRREQRIVDRAALGDEAAAVEVKDDGARLRAGRDDPPAAGLAHRDVLRSIVRFAPRDEGRRPGRQLPHALHAVGASQGGPRALQHAVDRPALYGRAHPGILPAMGRIFEVRKHAMFARWNRMAKQFARIGKDITIAVKSGGPDPGSNPSLRRVIQNARAINMPKDKVEAAIKRASGQGATDFQQVLYEGYAPHGVAVLVETATDNPTRTVASVRNILSKHGGNLASNGSVSFLFRRMGVFRLNPGGIDADELELDLIDHGLDEMGESTGENGEAQLVVRCAFEDFGHLQKRLEERKIAPISAEQEYVCTTPMELPEAQATEALELIDKLEQDDDVQKVYHTLA